MSPCMRENPPTSLPSRPANDGKKSQGNHSEPIQVRNCTSLTTLRILEDDDLVAELASGHHDALTVLFDRHSALVFRIARRILRDDGEAEETVQQVFLDVYRSIAQFDPRRGSFK